jgi:hypothetical protein
MVRDWGIWLWLLSSVVWAAQLAPIDAVVMPVDTYSIGVYPFSAFSVPSGYTVGLVELDKTQWTDPSTFITYAIEFSMDNGVTWNQVPGCGGVTYGGSIDPRTGLPSTVARISCPIAQPANTQRQIHGEVIVSGGSITTSVKAGLR